MKCTACNQEIQGEAKFCPYCGSPLENSPEPIKSVETETKSEDKEPPQPVAENTTNQTEKLNPLIMVALGLLILAVIAPVIMPIINYEGTWNSGSVTVFTIGGVTDIEPEHLIIDEGYAGGFGSTVIYCGAFLIAAVTFFRVYVSKKGYIPYLLTISGFCWGEYQAYTAFSERFANYYNMNASIGMGFVIALLALMASLGLVVYYQKNQMG